MKHANHGPLVFVSCSSSFAGQCDGGDGSCVNVVVGQVHPEGD